MGSLEIEVETPKGRFGKDLSEAFLTWRPLIFDSFFRIGFESVETLEKQLIEIFTFFSAASEGGFHFRLFYPQGHAFTLRQ
jgi:hypothetical protein